MTAQFQFPNDSERTVVLGRTGSGKTYFLTWLLSHASIDRMPWIVIDHKGSSYLHGLPYIEPIKIGDLPEQPGLYIVSPTFRDDEALDDYLHSILEHGNIGMFTDEGASIPQAEPRFLGLKSIFAQGREKKVPILFATQRPKRINMSVLSEGDYYAVFHLQNAYDRKAAANVIPKNLMETRLERFHSVWYDIKQGVDFVVTPVNDDETQARIAEKLEPPVTIERKRVNMI